MGREVVQSSASGLHLRRLRVPVDALALMKACSSVAKRSSGKIVVVLGWVLGDNRRGGVAACLALGADVFSARIAASRTTMQRQTRTWRYVVVLGLIATCAQWSVANAGDDSKVVAKPLPPGIVKAWRDAGAEVGWMKMDSSGYVRFYPLDAAKAGALPAFRFSKWNAGAIGRAMIESCG